MSWRKRFVSNVTCTRGGRQLVNGRVIMLFSDWSSQHSESLRGFLGGFAKDPTCSSFVPDEPETCFSLVGKN